MRTGDAWEQDEIELAVAAYLRMLTLELQGQTYNKTEFRSGLLSLLKGRSKGAVERKHQNISAVLIHYNLPYISGYKPLYNYQRALGETVLARIDGNNELARLFNRAAETSYIQLNALLIHEPPPEFPYGEQTVPTLRRPQIIDFVQREAENRALGRAGEELIFNSERERLLAAGRDDLAQKVEWVSKTCGDGAGFDILSFNERTEDEKLIEVKTTTQGKYFPFYASRNEVRVSEERTMNYELHRVFTFTKGPRVYRLQGALSTTCKLDATQFEARPKQ